MEDYYIHVYKEHINEICAGCKYCEFDACLVSTGDDFYHGYDGTSCCAIHDDDSEETSENRLFISALWKKCHKFEKPKKEDYIKELAMHIVYALYKYPHTKGKTKTEVVENVLKLYSETLKLYHSKKNIIYNHEFFEPIVERYTDFFKDNEHNITYNTLKNEILDLFLNEFFK